MASNSAVQTAMSNRWLHQTLGLVSILQSLDFTSPPFMTRAVQTRMLRGVGTGRRKPSGYPIVLLRCYEFRVFLATFLGVLRY